MTPERFHRLKQALAERQHDLTVLADGVHKQHNVSAIIRTCDAVGLARVHVVTREDDFRRHHMVAGGSKRWVQVEQHESTEAAYEALRKAGMRILAAHAGEDAVSYRTIDFKVPTAIVLGGELEGPTPYAIEHADAAIAIPMHGLVESLNVSVAAAVILYEAERQRAESNLYRRPVPDSQVFTRTLFEWAHPNIAQRCRDLGVAYPPLDEGGDLAANPFTDL